MNDGVYNGTRILKKETVELMHAVQPGNPIGSFWYGLAWMHKSVWGLSTSGHGGDLPGVETWMLYNQTEDTGVIVLANGNSGLGILPYQGACIDDLILYSLFTKGGAFREETKHEFTVSSDLFFKTSLTVLNR
jgi:CubicO group peptidase (beta-lactamase class C family)